MIKFLQSQTTEARRDLILHGSITNTLIMLSIPTLMMGLVQSMVPLMDGLFLNNVAGRLIASSINFAEPIINMMTALSQGLGVAAMAIVGQYNGLGDFKNAKKVSTQIVVSGVLFGIAMGPTLYIVSILVSMNLQEGVKESVFQYLSLYSFVMPMTFMAAIYNGLKNASGKPEATFIRMLLLLIFKIIFNFIYVYFLQLKIVGSVLASFSTYSLISVWMYYDLFVKESEDKLTLKGFKFDISILKQLMVIGIPSMLTTFLSNFGFFLINSEVEKYGQIVLNGNGIANNITAVCFNMPAAFGSAVTTMVSMNIGAQYSDKAKKSCYMGIIMSIITSIILIAIILPLSKYMTVLFTRDFEDLAIANGALPIYALSIIGFGVTMVVQGALIGLGRTRVPLFISILRIWFLRYIFILMTSSHLQYWSVFYGNLFSNTMSGIITFIIILKTPWRSVINMKTQNTFILRAKLFSAFRGDLSVKDLCQLNFAAGKCFADAANTLIAEFGKPDLISSHGQTIYHYPFDEKLDGISLKSTLQIGESSVIAHETGCMVVSNFREKDLDTLLDLMKQAQVNIPLKAVITPSNKNWVFGDLLAHLSEEHAAFTAAAKEQA